ncbi:hypothetical protein PBRA_003368 [Plasmodiophora brassicae]|nr:hypothetical protein PBRA_003368 [Plasmodiophora brassicae]
MRASMRIALWLALATAGAAETFFSEKFADKTWKDRWEVSDWKKQEGTNGKWGWSHGEFYGDAQEDKGLFTTQDARYYGISGKMRDEPFSNEGRDLVIQYSIKFPYMVDCAGGYLKLLRAGLDQKSFSGASDYAIMFGPDICGAETRKVHAILNFKGNNLEKKTPVLCEIDKFTHWYTFVIRPDNTYVIKVDNVEKDSGNLLDEWTFLPPKRIPDPSAKKPDDWVDDPMMDDPSQVKPADWDDEPEKIPDPEAVKPEDWDDDADGEWEPNMIDNPKYKGVWKPTRIDNPNYKGQWVAPEIDNPDFIDDPNVYVQKDLQFVGFELWQMKSGSIIDNILVTDDEEEAAAEASAWLSKNKKGEEKMNEEIEKAERIKREKERREAEGLPPAEDPGEFEDDEDEDIDLDSDDDEKEEL